MINNIVNSNSEVFEKCSKFINSHILHMNKDNKYITKFVNYMLTYKNGIYGNNYKVTIDKDHNRKLSIFLSKLDINGIIDISYIILKVLCTTRKGIILNKDIFNMHIQTINDYYILSGKPENCLSLDNLNYRELAFNIAPEKRKKYKQKVFNYENHDELIKNINNLKTEDSIVFKKITEKLNNEKSEFKKKLILKHIYKSNNNRYNFKNYLFSKTYLSGKIMSRSLFFVFLELYNIMETNKELDNHELKELEKLKDKYLSKSIKKENNQNTIKLKQVNIKPIITNKSETLSAEAKLHLCYNKIEKLEKILELIINELNFNIELNKKQNISTELFTQKIQNLLKKDLS